MYLDAYSPWSAIACRTMKHFLSLVLDTKEPFYVCLFAVLACAWCTISAAILFTLLMTFFPDYRGWGDGLRELEVLVAPDPMFWSS